MCHTKHLSSSIKPFFIILSRITLGVDLVRPSWPQSTIVPLLPRVPLIKIILTSHRVELRLPAHAPRINKHPAMAAPIIQIYEGTVADGRGAVNKMKLEASPWEDRRGDRSRIGIMEIVEGFSLFRDKG